VCLQRKSQSQGELRMELNRWSEKLILFVWNGAGCSPENPWKMLSSGKIGGLVTVIVNSGCQLNWIKEYPENR
jgi:hypothetical protein